MYHTSHWSHAAAYADHSEELLQRMELTGRVPSKEKFRRMACNTFVSTGGCPYGDRCVFLHDERVRNEKATVRTTRQVKDNNAIKDSFYWPDMPRQEVTMRVDAQGLPSVNQEYNIPAVFGYNRANMHNRALFSIWSHFIEFCLLNNDNVFDPVACNKSFFHNNRMKQNRYVEGVSRLPIFVAMSHGESVTAASDAATTTMSLASHDSLASSGLGAAKPSSFAKLMMINADEGRPRSRTADRQTERLSLRRVSKDYTTPATSFEMSHSPDHLGSPTSTLSSQSDYYHSHMDLLRDSKESLGGSQAGVMGAAAADHHDSFTMKRYIESMDSNLNTFNGHVASKHSVAHTTPMSRVPSSKSILSAHAKRQSSFMSHEMELSDHSFESHPPPSRATYRESSFSTTTSAGHAPRRDVPSDLPYVSSLKIVAPDGHQWGDDMHTTSHRSLATTYSDPYLARGSSGQSLSSAMFE